MDYKKLIEYVESIVVDNDMVKLLFDFVITFDNYNQKKYRDVIENIVIEKNSLGEISFKIIGFNRLCFDSDEGEGFINKFVFSNKENKLMIELWTGEWINIDIKDILSFNITHRIVEVGGVKTANDFDVIFEVIKK